MVLNIKSPEADRLARELSTATGESLTTAVERALQERLERAHSSRPELIERRVRALRDEVAHLPVLDDRSSDAIIGYDEHGLPR